ncbi:hypothetical protein ACQJBY_034631 [Aegilops geniculata]
MASHRTKQTQASYPLTLTTPTATHLLGDTRRPHNSSHNSALSSVDAGGVPEDRGGGARAGGFRGAVPGYLDGGARAGGLPGGVPGDRGGRRCSRSTSSVVSSGLARGGSVDARGAARVQSEGGCPGGARWSLPPAGSGRRSTGPGPSGVAVERCWCQRRRNGSCGSPLVWRHDPRGRRLASGQGISLRPFMVRNGIRRRRTPTTVGTAAARGD